MYIIFYMGNDKLSRLDTYHAFWTVNINISFTLIENIPYFTPLSSINTYFIYWSVLYFIMIWCPINFNLWLIFISIICLLDFGHFLLIIAIIWIFKPILSVIAWALVMKLLKCSGYENSIKIAKFLILWALEICYPR